VVLATGRNDWRDQTALALVSRDFGYESGVQGEVLKLDGKVFDEYLEVYVDAHDKGERMEGPTDAVRRIVAFWAVNNARGGLYAPCIAFQLGLRSSGLAG
jgi:hypothetical protein